MHGCRTQVLVAADYVELGPRLNRSNLEYVILQGSQLYRVVKAASTSMAAAAGRASCRGGVDRLAAALVFQRLLPEHY